MSQTAVRILLSLAIVVAVPCLYMISFTVLERAPGLSDEEALLWSNVVAALLVVLGWIRVWRGSVRWTAARGFRTAVAVPATAAVAATLGLGSAVLLRYDEIGIIVGGGLWLALWIAAIALIWRETPGERAGRLRLPGDVALACPKCGYDLRGLHEARCPECGTQYTLDGLLALLLARRDELAPGVDEPLGVHADRPDKPA